MNAIVIGNEVSYYKLINEEESLMEKKDFIKLIKAAEGVMILEDACKVIQKEAGRKDERTYLRQM